MVTNLVADESECADKDEEDDQGNEVSKGAHDCGRRCVASRKSSQVAWYCVKAVGPLRAGVKLVGKVAVAMRRVEMCERKDCVSDKCLLSQ